MADFDLNSIGQLLTNGGLSAISKRVKLKQSDIAQVLSSGIPSMLAGMQSNVGTAEGEESLAHALADHSKDDIANIGAFLKGADLEDGKKILGHIFGDNKDETLQGISEATGVTKAKATSILAMVAPLLLSMLGNQQNAQSGNSGFSLLGMLGGLLGGGQQQSSSLLGSLLGGAASNSSGGILDTILNLFH